MSDQHTLEANDLVSRIEGRAMQIFKFTENPKEKRDNVAGFRKFSTMVDEFHQAAEIAEVRLTTLKTGRREELRRYVMQIRAKILKMEIDVTQTYLEGLIEARAPLPFGAREFFQTRLKRLSELSKMLADGPDADGSAAALMENMRKMLEHLMENAPQLEVFEREADYRPPQRSGTQAARPAAKKIANSESSESESAPASSKAVRLDYKDNWGRIFLDKKSFDTVTVVCRTRGMSLDNIASRLGMTRVALTLILNGQDPIQRNTLDMLHRVLNGGSGAAAE